MKILVLADEESKPLYDFFDKSRVEGIDLIISCGDLDPRYLSFLVTMTNVPLLYVHGNHDEKYAFQPPEGCICIDDKIFVHEGIRIMGLGGSMRYRPGNFQYTEREMQARVNKMKPKLFWRRGIDILVAHSPAKGINDGVDLPHQGFQVFRTLMEQYHPQYFLHGHVHMTYTHNFVREDQYQQTTVINGFERVIIEIPDKEKRR